MNEAEAVQAQALREEQTQDVRSLATDLLIRGYPSAFSGESTAELLMKGMML